MLPDPVQKPHAEAVRGAQIGDDQIRDAMLHELHGLDLARRFINLVPLVAKKGGQRRARRFVVVDNKDSSSIWEIASGYSRFHDVQSIYTRDFL